MLRIFCRNLSTQPSLTIKDKILNKLNSKFGTNLVCAQVNNLSWKHNEPQDSYKFLEVIVVSTEFEGVNKSKRNDLIKDLLKNEIKDTEVTFKLLTPSKWYDSNQRGLKLNEVYSNPPVFNGNLQEIAKKFYSNQKSA